MLDEKATGAESEGDGGSEETIRFGQPERRS